MPMQTYLPFPGRAAGLRCYTSRCVPNRAVFHKGCSASNSLYRVTTLWALVLMPFEHLIPTFVTVQFNRSMRLKANKMGYSLNQRGLFAGVVRSVGDRTVKTNAGGSRPLPS
jgi:hypothetical protein